MRPGIRTPHSDTPARSGNWRSGPESNRHPRICSPMHHHSATGPPCRFSPGKPPNQASLRARRRSSRPLRDYPESAWQAWSAARLDRSRCRPICTPPSQDWNAMCSRKLAKRPTLMRGNWHRQPDPRDPDRLLVSHQTNCHRSIRAVEGPAAQHHPDLVSLAFAAGRASVLRSMPVISRAPLP